MTELSSMEMLWNLYGPAQSFLLKRETQEIEILNLSRTESVLLEFDGNALGFIFVEQCRTKICLCSHKCHVMKSGLLTIKCLYEKTPHRLRMIELTSPISGLQFFLIEDTEFCTPKSITENTATSGICSVDFSSSISVALSLEIITSFNRITGNFNACAGHTEAYPFNEMFGDVI